MPLVVGYEGVSQVRQEINSSDTYGPSDGEGCPSRDNRVQRCRNGVSTGSITHRLGGTCLSSGEASQRGGNDSSNGELHIGVDIKVLIWVFRLV